MSKLFGVTELYKVPNKTWVEVQINGLPKIFFDHIDGMYSYCTDIDGNVCHYKAWTPVKVIDAPKDSYKTRT